MKRTVLILILAVFFLTLAACNSGTDIPPLKTPPAPEVFTGIVTADIKGPTEVPCPFDLPIDEVEGETAFCGQIVVPQDWDDPDVTQITISYVVFLAADANPSPDPIIYFEGGPGISSIADLSFLSNTFSHLRQNRDLIFWDQRGNLYSSHLDCPDEVRDPRTALSQEDLQATLTVQAESPHPTLDPALLEPSTIYDNPVEVLEKELALTEFFALTNDPKANCRNYYDGKDVDLTKYSTASSVRDVIELMEQLNYEEYNHYAISYGTTLALETMRYYDEHSQQDLPRMRAVVIDGVYPLYVDSAEMGLIQPYNILRVFNDCEGDPACVEVYPNIHQRLLELLKKVENQDLILNGEVEITLTGLMSLLNFGSTADPVSLVFLPRLIDELERGDTAVYEHLQERVNTSNVKELEGVQAADVLTMDTENAINCNSRSANLDVNRAFELYRSFEAPQLIAEIIPVFQSISNCEAWGLKNESAPLPDPVTSNQRTLVSNGAMDPSTAVEWGEVAYASLTNAEFVTYPFAHHGASAITDCGKVVTKAFFDDPQAELDLSCVEDIRPVFVLPGDDLTKLSQ